MSKYSFRAKVWKYKGKAGWYFVTLPPQLSRKIRKNHGVSEEGWGRLKAVAKIGNSKWSTSIWFDRRANSYLLPLKASVRKKEAITVSGQIEVALNVKADRQKKLIFTSLG
jgi:Domain of unknown function (DUF1905)